MVMTRKEYFANRFHTDVPVVVRPASAHDTYNPMDVEVAETMFPVDKYGRLTDLLTRLLNSDSQLERNQLLNMMEDTSTSVGKEFARLDDATKLQLLKPRSVQSFAEMERYSQYVDDFITKNNVKDTEPTAPTEPTEPTAPTEPTEPTAPTAPAN